MNARRAALIPVILLGLLIIGSYFSYHATDSTEVGVRTRKLSLFGKTGVDPTVYQPGSTYFFLPIVNDWDTFDTRLVIVEMKGDSKSGRREDLAFKTIEGNDINLDVVFSYRIDPKRVAYIKQYVAADDFELREKVFKTVARSRTRDFFGELTTEHFYKAEERNAAAEKAREGLAKILEPYGIILEKVALMDYRFHETYAEVIKQKKLAEAKTAEIQAQLEAQKEMNQKILNDADGLVNEMVAKANGEYTNTVAAADAYFDQQGMLAKAIIKEGENTAEAIKKQREAMATAGGETQVRMRIAENLKNKRIIMVPGNDGGINLRTLDLNAFLKAIGQGQSRIGELTVPRATESR